MGAVKVIMSLHDDASSVITTLLDGQLKLASSGRILVSESINHLNVIWDGRDVRGAERSKATRSEIENALDVRKIYKAGELPLGADLMDARDWVMEIAVREMNQKWK